MEGEDRYTSHSVINDQKFGTVMSWYLKWWRGDQSFLFLFREENVDFRGFKEWFYLTLPSRFQFVLPIHFSGFSILRRAQFHCLTPCSVRSTSAKYNSCTFSWQSQGPVWLFFIVLHAPGHLLWNIYIDRSLKRTLPQEIIIVMLLVCFCIVNGLEKCKCPSVCVASQIFHSLPFGFGCPNQSTCTRNTDRSPRTQ
jgi:hypothetical protein